MTALCNYELTLHNLLDTFDVVSVKELHFMQLCNQSSIENAKGENIIPSLLVFFDMTGKK